MPSPTSPPRNALGGSLGVGLLLSALVVWLGLEYILDSRAHAVALAGVQARTPAPAIDQNVSGILIKVAGIVATLLAAIWGAVGMALFAWGRHGRDLEARRLEHARVEAALRESEQRFNTAFEDMPMALGIGRLRDGTLLCVNKAFGELVGYTKEELMGGSSTRLHIWADPGDRDRVVQRLQAGETVRDFEMKVRRKDGREVVVSYSGTVVRLGDEPCLLSGAVDISDRKRAEEEARQYQVALFQAQRLESLGSLAGGVAHDMNNVLAAILGLASALREYGGMDPGAQRSMDTIVRACQRGSTLVKGLLGFARKGLAEWHPLDLNPLVLEEVSLLERTTLQKVQLRVELDPKPCWVQGDASALSHALMNLCVNAVDAMGSEGTLTLRTCHEGDDWVRLEVTDTGAGMPPGVLEKALDPFFSTKPVGQGTGLGLPIVYGTVQAHHGHLAITSTPGAGTTVTVRLPAAEPRSEVQVPTPAGATPTAPLEVLLVDDDELIRQSGEQLLVVLGHHATVVESAEAALALLEGGASFDVVLLDVNMPGMSGLEAAPRMAILRPDLPILLATGRADQRAMDAAAALPRVRLLPKPYSLQELRDNLHEL